MKAEALVWGSFLSTSPSVAGTLTLAFTPQITRQSPTLNICRVPE